MPTPREQQAENIIDLLENLIWPPEIEQDIWYCIQHDDTDGSDTGILKVRFAGKGDAFLSTDTHQGLPLRFRTESGGSHCPRIRNALMILALAIELENKPK